MNSDTYSTDSYPSRYKVEERPTSPALPHTLPFLIYKVRWSPSTSSYPNVLCVEWVSSPPFIASKIGLGMGYTRKHVGTSFKKIRGNLQPSCN